MLRASKLFRIAKPNTTICLFRPMASLRPFGFKFLSKSFTSHATNFKDSSKTIYANAAPTVLLPIIREHFKHEMFEPKISTLDSKMSPNRLFSELYSYFTTILMFDPSHISLKLKLDVLQELNKIAMRNHIDIAHDFKFLIFQYVPSHDIDKFFEIIPCVFYKSDVFHFVDCVESEKLEVLIGKGLDIHAINEEMNHVNVIFRIDVILLLSSTNEVLTKRLLSNRAFLLKKGLQEQTLNSEGHTPSEVAKSLGSYF